MASFQRKRNRLDLHLYRCGYPCLITSSTAERRRIFRDVPTGNKLLVYIAEAANKFGVAVLAYCVMPDHVHLLVHAPAGTSPIDFVHCFKQKSGYYLKQDLGVPVWQASFHDHVVRRNEDMLSIIRYTFANPVRAGIVASPGDYPLSGSFVWDRDAAMEA